MRTCILFVSLFMAMLSVAQRPCASTEYMQEQKLRNPSLASRLNAIEDFIQHQLSVSTKLNGDGSYRVIHIPVVVHILYNTPDQNLSEAQVISQIDAINRDFRRQNSDTVNIPSRFKPYAADVEIEFALAKTDPSGHSTTGIIRKQTSVGYWNSDDNIKYTELGGDDAWDSRFYFNIWVGNMRTLLGYSSAPGVTAERDGVVINTSVFGTIDKGGPYNRGRTLVHETGHWLGLKHIWGETYCGDDGVEDTPRQSTYTSGCPTSFRSTCDNGAMGDMYMNYMDYTNDGCMNLFTIGQKQRMLALFAYDGPRSKLLSSIGFSNPWNTEAVNSLLPVATNKVQLFPNPTRSEVTLRLNSKWTGKTIVVLNASGSVVSTLRVTGGILKINVASLRSGVYFIQGQSEGQKLSEKLVVL